MTIEDARHWLEIEMKLWESECKSKHPVKDALKMAIKALEQEPCEDAISRDAAVTEINKYHMTSGVTHQCVWNECVGVIAETIQALPPVTPQIKTGHWIMPIQDDGMSDPIYYQVRCSNCGFDVDPQSWFLELHKYGADKYCPKCGAKMVEPQESEE